MRARPPLRRQANQVLESKATLDLELKATLEEERRHMLADLHGRVRHSEGGVAATTSDVVDSAESAEADVQGALHFALIEMKAQVLRRIEEALSRARDARFGRCAECGDKIPPPRLRALPFALRCTACEQGCETVLEIAQSKSRRSTGPLFELS